MSWWRAVPSHFNDDRGDLWDSGKVDSDQSTFVVYAGRPLASGARCYWKVRAWDKDGQPSPWSAPGSWSMGLLRDSDWSGRFIGLGRPADVKEGTPLPFPWLRKTFELKEKPRRAMAYVNPLGYYELYINGKKVDDHVLSPAVSDYSKRNLYLTHDVTDYLVAGKNCVALWLGRGWYVRGHPGVIHDGPLVRAQLDLLLPDGRTERIGTDATWKVRESTLYPLGRGTAFGDYGGERYDARRELAGLERRRARRFRLASRRRSSTRPRSSRRRRWSSRTASPRRSGPVKVSEFSPGVYLVDMGRNFTGWLELRIPAGAATGAGVKLEYADFPPTGGRLATNNQRDEVIPPDGADADLPLALQLSRVLVRPHHGPEAAAGARGHQGIPDPHRLPAGGRIRVLQRPLQPDLQDGHLDLPVPDAGRLRGGLPAPRAPGLRRRRGHLDRDGHVQLHHGRAVHQVDRGLAGGAGPEDRRPALHGPQLPGPGRRRADVERLHRHAPLAALPPVRRQADPRGLVPQHPEVARVRGVEDRRSRARGSTRATG